MQRFQRSRAALVFGLLALLLGTAQQPAWACSRPEPTLELMAELAAVVVVGTLSDASEDTIKLNVEEQIKGDLDAKVLTLNNHRVVPRDGASCEVVLGEGSWLSDGTRVLAFLGPDEHGLADWRPVNGGVDFLLEVDPDEQLVYAGGQSGPPLGTLEEARRRLEVWFTGVEPGAEPGGGAPGAEPGLIDPGFGGPILIDPLPMPPIRGREPVVRPAPADVEETAPSVVSIPKIMLGTLLVITALLVCWNLFQSLRRGRAKEL